MCMSQMRKRNVSPIQISKHLSDKYDTAGHKLGVGLAKKKKKKKKTEQRSSLRY